MLVSPTQNSGVGGIAQRQPPTPGILCRSGIYALRIDKGSWAVSHVSGCSGGTISSAVTIYIPYERLYFSSSYDVKYIIF